MNMLQLEIIGNLGADATIKSFKKIRPAYRLLTILKQEENEATDLCKGCLFERFGNYCQTYIKVVGNCMERSDCKSVIFVIEEE